MEFFKILGLVKDNEIDLEKSWTYFSEKLNEPDWKKMAKTIFDYCSQVYAAGIPDLQKRSNFTKETCDIKYHAVVECIELYMITVGKS